MRQIFALAFALSLCRADLAAQSATTVFNDLPSVGISSSASLRSDHDAAVPVITMAWTD